MGNSAAISAARTALGGPGDAGAAGAALQDWLGAIVPGVPVSLATAAAGDGEEGIAIRLIEVTPRIVPLSPQHKSSALALDYLVTVGIRDAQEAQAALVEIAFAAQESGDYEIVAGRQVAELCRASGIPLVPGVVLRAELRRDTPVRLAPLVREAPRPSLEPLVQARGRVVGPGNFPIAGALVTIAGSARTCTTGPDGRFRFAIPAGQPATVTARARSREVTSSLAPETETILTLQLEA